MTRRTAFDGVQIPVRRVERSAGAEIDARSWPFTIPAVAQVLQEGLDLEPATVLIGENGAGKSTLVEGIAMAYGLSPEGGSTGAMHSTYASESPLHRALRLVRGIGVSRWGFFIRGETLHGLFTYLHHNPGRDPAFHEMSHGESFSQLLSTSRFDGPGLFVMDEPEAGLSFNTLLSLLVNLQAMVEAGGQVLLATHSPILASFPKAKVLQLTADGIEELPWDDLDMVNDYRRFLAAPERYHRHLFD